MKKLTNNEILEILNSSKTQKEAIINLGLKPNGTGFREINNICKNLNFDIKKITGRKTKEEYYLSPKRCKNCNTIINWENRNNIFCSHSCSATYNNLGVIRSEIPRKFYYFCQNCGSEFEHKKTQKYCSNKCHNEFLYNEYVKLWKTGNTDGKKGLYQTSSHIRKYLFEKNNNKCQKCGWGELSIYTNKIPLEIHHIDGDCTNNNENNLELLCPNCHSLTNTFGSLNKNSKREFREKKSKND